MKKEFQEICNIYKNRYVSIFRQLYPTSKKSGFTERNLSVNFAVAYENYSCQMKQNTVTWYEFQFGKKNNEHFDAIIINFSTREILIIESKRYNNMSKQLKAVNKDIGRIKLFPSIDLSRIPKLEQYKLYGVILADIRTSQTTSVKLKKAIIEQYRKKVFVEKNKKVFTNCTDKDVFEYNVQNFRDCNTVLQEALICSDYYLLSMFWEINNA